MAKKNFYAVKKGLTPGIYTTWEECQYNITGFSGAQYKGFTTIQEAEMYLYGRTITPAYTPPIPPSYTGFAPTASNGFNGQPQVASKRPLEAYSGYAQPVLPSTPYAAPERASEGFEVDDNMEDQETKTGGMIKSGTLHQIIEGAPLLSDLSGEEYEKLRRDDSVISAFVDGSYDKTCNYYGYGFVAYGMNSVHAANGGGNDPDLVSMNNVAGEIIASEKAIRYAIAMGAKKVVIYHDYEGISKWATRKWKTNKNGTITYSETCVNLSAKIEIAFRKVAGHTGVAGNEEADQLAKQGIIVARNKF